MNELAITFELNGERRSAIVAGKTLLIDYLRDSEQLKGAKIGCSRGVCGSCTVLIDGIPIAACSKFAFQIDGAAVTTIEGLANGSGLDPVQQAFVDNAAFQCGYCTAGMILITRALLTRHADPDRDTIVDWISSNVCRCAGYMQIIVAVQDAAQRLRDANR